MKSKNINKLLFIIVFTLLLVFMVTLKIQDTKIASSRNINRANICQYFQATFTLEQRELSKKSVAQFDLITNQQQITILKSGNFNAIKSGTIILTVPHIIALAVLLCLIPALFCCCTWPEKYPKCKKFRKPQKYQYKKEQLKIPAYGSVLFYIVIIVGSLMALAEASQIVKHYNNVGCKNATMFDDLLNGRMSTITQGKFYVGLLPLKSQLKTFTTSKISTFFSQGSNSLSTANQVRIKQNGITLNINNVYNSYNNQNYVGAFTPDGGITYTTVSSEFKDMFLGPVSDSSKILGNINNKLNQIINQINLALDDMISAWGVLSTKTQTGVNSQMNNFDAIINTYKQQIQNYLNLVGAKYYAPQFYSNMQIILKAFYGMVFAAALIGFISSLWISLCKVANCRFFMYFGCGSLSILSIIGLCFLSYLSFYHPQISEMCFLADQKLATGNGTKQLFTLMGLGLFADKIQPCINDGDGKILNKVNSAFSQSFDKINVIAQGTLKFNDKITSFTQPKIDAPFNQGFVTITKVSSAQVWDINDTMAKTHVQNIVSKFYPASISCNSLNVQGDVWMPSFDLISCPAGKAKMNPCANLALTTVCPLGCYQILNTITSPSGDASYASTLATRYSLSSCNYYQFIHKLYSIWIAPRRIRMDLTKVSINDIKNTVNDYTAKVDSVKANLNSFQTSLQSNFDSMTNLKSGSFNGMDCRVISESILQFRDSICIGLRNSIMYNIICLCLICYGTLLMSCFVTLAGVRHYQSSKGTIVRDNPNQYQNSSIIRQSNELVQSEQK